VDPDPYQNTTLEVRREGGTYHNTATLVGDVLDLEARKEQDTGPDPEGSVRNPRIRIRTKILRIDNTSVADAGCLSRIPDPNFTIQDTKKFRIPDPDPHQRMCGKYF
jgi:hypothetical protein